MAILDGTQDLKREKSLNDSFPEQIDEEKSPAVVVYSVDDHDSDYAVDPTIITRAEDVAVQVCQPMAFLSISRSSQQVDQSSRLSHRKTILLSQHSHSEQYF